MTTTMRVTHQLGGDVDSVHALMTDADFLQRKFASTGATDIHVECGATAAGGARVVVRRKVTVELPGFAAKFIQPTNTLVQTEEWAPPSGDGRRVCSYRVEVQGVPSHIDGTVTLSPDAGGTRQDVEAQVKVSIQLAGGKLEKLAVDSGTNLLRDEAEFTNRELGTR